jgi:hypothetical protein
VKFLIKTGANAGINSDLLLQFAIEKQSIKMLQLLLFSGANVNASNGYAFNLAVYKGNAAIVQLLIDNHMTITNEHSMAINYAVYKRYTKIVDMIKKYQDVSKWTLENKVLINSAECLISMEEIKTGDKYCHCITDHPQHVVLFDEYKNWTKYNHTRCCVMCKQQMHKKVFVNSSVNK